MGSFPWLLFLYFCFFRSFLKSCLCVCPNGMTQQQEEGHGGVVCEGGSQD